MGFAVDPGFAPIAASILLVVALVAVMAFLRGTRDDSARQFSKNSVSGFTGLVLGFILVMIFRLANAA